ncbi:MAG: excinuclease ABC subunit UvrC [Anaerolineae bacterium]|jgi:excinuclease ABC subunit C
MDEIRQPLEPKLASLPDKPGVYLMRDTNGRVIYVGKALVLRHRVRSYFGETALRDAKTARLVADIADIEWIVTESELEALILEAQLIKRHHPRYNIRLKDDKRYPYIKITMEEDFPRVILVRQMVADGGRYFGPFTSSQAVAQSLELVRRLFPYRTCNREITGQDRRPCLYYHIERCSGPCIGAIDRDDYRKTMDRIALFLEGRQEEVLAGLHQEMETSAEDLKFERAAKLRDEIAAITQIIERQRIVSSHLKDHDFVAFARANGDACVQVFFVRNGRLIGRDYFVLGGTTDASDEEIVRSFLVQFYEQSATIPPEVVVPSDLDNLGVMEEWLRQRRGSRVAIRVPKRGDRRQVLELAQENAVETLRNLRAEWDADRSKHVEALTELQEALGLPEPLGRIECYDISHIHGTGATGSMVVFAQGAPSKGDYRRFRIKEAKGGDDYAAMAEVLSRRFARAHAGQNANTPGARPNRWALMPDLVIIDGGKGQLGAALGAMADAGVDHVPVVALAKREEEIFAPGNDAPCILAPGSAALHLVQRIRDEAHRVAVSYHRTVRRRESTRSVLEDIPGIGPKRRQALLKAFGSIEGVRQASVDELAAVPGMTRPVAERLRQQL